MKFNFAFLKLIKMLQKINLNKICYGGSRFCILGGEERRGGAEREGLVVVILQGDLYELTEGRAYAGDTEGALQLVQYVKAVVADVQLDISAAGLIPAVEVCFILGMAADIVKVVVKIVSQGSIDKHIGGLLAGLIRGASYFTQDIVGVRVYHHLYSNIALQHLVVVNIHGVPPFL